MVERADGGRRAVLHFVERWLPRSESFVYDLVTRTSHPAVVVSSCRTENRQLFPFAPLHSLLPVREPFRRYYVTPRLMALARRHSVGLVHVHHGYRVYEVIGAARRLGLPIVLSLHGHDITGYVEQHPDIYDMSIEVVDAIVVPSRYLAAVAAGVGFREERIHVIPSGVDTTFFVPTPLPSADREILFVGRFVEKKGLDTLMAAWPHVRRAVPEARLRLLGFGPLEPLARSSDDGIEVVLRPDRNSVREAMRRAYVVVTPSRTAADDSVESLLIVNLEAQASGRPVVTTRHGGIPEFVREGETALVVPEADSDALATALVTVLRDRDLANRLAGRGPEWVRRFDSAVCAGRVDALYDSLMRADR